MSFMYIMFKVESVPLKKSKSLCFVSKEKFLKCDGVKSNYENVMRSNDGIPSPHGSENEGVFWMILYIEIFRVKNSSVAS